MFKKNGARGHGESRCSEMYAAEPSLYVDEARPRPLIMQLAASMRARNRNPERTRITTIVTIANVFIGTYDHPDDHPAR